MKTCDGCVACCNGTLNITIEKEEVNRNHPCSKICLDKKNCSDYNNRPSVCSIFKCLWLTQDDIPEWLKPSNCGMLLLKRNGYLEIHSVNHMTLTADVFMIALHFAYMNKWPVKFYLDCKNTAYRDMIGGSLSLIDSNLQIGTRHYEEELSVGGGVSSS